MNIYPRFADKQCEWIEMYLDCLIKVSQIEKLRYRKAEYLETFISICYKGVEKSDIFGQNEDIPDLNNCFKRLKHMVLTGMEYKEL